MLERELEHLESAHLLRALTAFSDVTSTRVTIGNHRLLLCASNNYLGLATDERVQKAAITAVRRYGTGATGSRLTTGHTDMHAHLERSIAELKGTAAALLFSSGYLANLGAITALLGPEDEIFSDELNHASIIDGCRLSRARVNVYRHSDMDHLESLLRKVTGARRRMIVTDGVFSMDGDIARLPDLVRLRDDYHTMLMVDDAHATGVIGARGAGTADHFGVPSEAVDLHMGTLSKALGAEGGFVAGSAKLIAFLTNRARSFIFNTGLAPASVGAAVASIEIAASEPERRETLEYNGILLRRRLERLGLSVVPGVTPIIPVVLGDAKRAMTFSASLLASVVYAPAIRPPTVPTGSARIRLTLTAQHSKEDIQQIVEAFAEACSKVLP